MKLMKKIISILLKPFLILLLEMTELEREIYWRKVHGHPYWLEDWYKMESYIEDNNARKLIMYLNS